MHVIDENLIAFIDAEIKRYDEEYDKLWATGEEPEMTMATTYLARRTELHRCKMVHMRSTSCEWQMPI